MRVVRGRTDDPETDRSVTAALLEHTAETGEAGIRVYRPHRQVAFGRRDGAGDGYDRARQIARSLGYAPVERDSGGRAVAYTGETIAFAYTVATENSRADIQHRYRGVTSLLERALRSVGAAARRGEPEASFCPGEHSLQCGGKIVGLAQRVTRDAALVGGCVIVCEADEDELATVLDPVYDALGVPFDPDAIGSVEGAGGTGDGAAVVDSIESTFTEGYEAEVVAGEEFLRRR